MFNIYEHSIAKSRPFLWWFSKYLMTMLLFRSSGISEVDRDLPMDKKRMILVAADVRRAQVTLVHSHRSHC